MKKTMTIIILAILILGLGVTAYAHAWPENLADWSSEDWRIFNEYWANYYKAQQQQYCNPYGYGYNNPYYNPNPYNNTGYYPHNANTTERGNGYNNSYNYWNYSYHSGVLDVYQPETEDQAVILAKIIWLYAHGVASQTQQAAVGWAVMNSIDDSTGAENIGSIASNFHYDASKPTVDDFGRDLMPLARDVIFRWKAGRAGISDNGRVLPNGYDYVTSNGIAVAFTQVINGVPWNFAWGTPYAN